MGEYVLRGVQGGRNKPAEPKVPQTWQVSQRPPTLNVQRYKNLMLTRTYLETFCAGVEETAATIVAGSGTGAAGPGCRLVGMTDGSESSYLQR
jgi:hypothetical protein